MKKKDLLRLCSVYCIALTLFLYRLYPGFINFVMNELMILLCFIIVVISHELGHLIFGWAMMYKLDYIDLLYIRLSPGIGVQRLNHISAKCTMQASQTTSIRIRHGCYILGGLLINFIQLIISIILMYSKVSICISIKAFTVVWAAMNAFFILVNLFPFEGNDLSVVHALTSRERSAYLQIILLLQAGMSLAEIPYKLFNEAMTYANSSRKTTLIKFLYLRCLENGDYRNAIIYFKKNESHYLKSTHLSDKAEFLFYYSFLNPRIENTQLIFKKLSNPIMASNILSKERIIFAYQRFIEVPPIEVGKLKHRAVLGLVNTEKNALKILKESVSMKAIGKS